MCLPSKVSTAFISIIFFSLLTKSRFYGHYFLTLVNNLHGFLSFKEDLQATMIVVNLGLKN